MTVDLAAVLAFVRARLDGDEQTARATIDEQSHGEWHAAGAQGDDEAARTYWRVVGIARPDPTPAARAIAEHIARHGPARVLAEVDAKRRTLARCDEALLSAVPALVHFAEQTVRELALPYAGHPDFPPDA